ncbi:MAG: guanylate kinase [Frankiaceae bacterium]|nr:guanylate kinase [Frankiaceae bacterium]MBV9869253.1 guanylate kinase [Frankiaceae bacterium]
MTTNRLTVLSGPAGVGKSTVVAYLREHEPRIWHSVSVTTRAMRPGEVEGGSYHFVDRDQFEAMIAAGAFLEYAEYAGNLYGTPRQPVEEHLAAGDLVLLEIEIQGARQVRQLMPDARLVFLAPPTWEELERRLRGRGTEPPDVIARRLDQARIELAAEAEFDAVILSSSVAEAARQLVALMAP